MHLTSEARALYKNLNLNLFPFFNLFFFVTQLRRAWWADDGESSTDVGKTRQRGEVAEERGE